MIFGDELPQIKWDRENMVYCGFDVHFGVFLCVQRVTSVGRSDQLEVHWQRMRRLNSCTTCEQKPQKDARVLRGRSLDTEVAKRPSVAYTVN